MLEDKVLKLLFASSDNILDDEELVETLNDMKVKFVAISYGRNRVHGLLL